MKEDRDKFDDEFEDEFFEDMEEEAANAMNNANKPSTLGIVGAVLFGVVLVGGIGYMGYRKLFAGKKNDENETCGSDTEE